MRHLESNQISPGRQKKINNFPYHDSSSKATDSYFTATIINLLKQRRRNSVFAPPPIAPLN